MVVPTELTSVLNEKINKAARISRGCKLQMRLTELLIELK